MLCMKKKQLEQSETKWVWNSSTTSHATAASVTDGQFNLHSQLLNITCSSIKLPFYWKHYINYTVPTNAED